jgi:hypothetical protein
MGAWSKMRAQSGSSNALVETPPAAPEAGHESLGSADKEALGKGSNPPDDPGLDRGDLTGDPFDPRIPPSPRLGRRRPDIEATRSRALQHELTVRRITLGLVGLSVISTSAILIGLAIGAYPLTSIDPLATRFVAPPLALIGWALYRFKPSASQA